MGKHHLMDDGLKAAIKAVGGIRPLARLLGITHQAILQWDKVPAERILEIESITGVMRERLRGDLYRRAKEWFTCEICFQDMNGARAAMAELAKHGIKTKIFDDIHDPFSSAVFVGAWRAGDVSFEKIVDAIADSHEGSADSFGVDDHVPVPSDFGFHLPAETVSAEDAEDVP